MIHATQISYTFPVNFFFHSSVSAGHIGRRNKSAPIQEIIAWQQFTAFSGSVPAPTTNNYTEGTRAVLLHLPGPGTSDRQQLRSVNNTDNI